MAIAGQQNGSAIDLTVSPGGRIEGFLSTSETEPVFDGETSWGNLVSCGFPGINVPSAP